MPQSWKTLDLPIVTIAKTIQIWLEPSREGRLRLSTKKEPFPQGELYLIVSSWSQTSHWLIPAEQEGDVISADLTGTECAYDPEDDRPLLVDLAVRTEQGLIRYPLRANRLYSQMSERNRCLYLFDERKWFSGPVDEFLQGDLLMESIPAYVPGISKAIAIGLRIQPRSLRYWQQMSYGLTDMEEGNNQLICKLRAPIGAPELLGLSLHRLDGDERTQQFFPVETGHTAVTVPLDRLPMDGAEYALSGVYQQEGDILYHVPLSVIEPKLHQRLSERVNGIPCREEDGCKCYLRLDDLCRPTFLAAKEHPDRQRSIPGCALKEALETEQLPVKGHCCVRDLGGQDWQWHLELPGLVLPETTQVWVLAVLRLEHHLMPVKVLPTQGQDTVLSVDFSSLTEHLQNSHMNRWELSLAFEREGDWYHLRMKCPLHMIRRNLDVDSEYLDYSRAYSGVIGTAPMGMCEVQAELCCVQDGCCMLQTQDGVRRFDYHFVCRVERAALVGKTLEITIRCPACAPGRWVGTIFP